MEEDRKRDMAKIKNKEKKSFSTLHSLACEGIYKKYDRLYVRLFAIDAILIILLYLILGGNHVSRELYLLVKSNKFAIIYLLFTLIPFLVVTIMYFFDTLQIRHLNGVANKFLENLARNSKTYGMLLDSDDYVMASSQDYQKDFFEELDISIEVDTLMKNFHMTVTSDFIYSRNDYKLKYDPLAIRKSMIESIAFFDKAIIGFGTINIYECVEIKLYGMTDEDKPIRRIVARKGLLGGRIADEGKKDPFYGLKEVEDNRLNSAPAFVLDLYI